MGCTINRHLLAPRTHPHLPGFTLVELIVVLGIIAALVAMLMPALAGARTRSQEVKCQAILRNIGQAAAIHVHDHNGYLPVAGRHWELPQETADPASLGDTRGMRYKYYLDQGRKRPMPVSVALAVSLGVQVRRESREALEADMQTPIVRGLFKCPSQTVDLAGCSQRDQTWEAPFEWTSYIYNEAILGHRDKRANPDPPMGKVTKIKRPSAVLFAMDGRPRGPGRLNWIMVSDMSPGYSLWKFHEVAADPKNDWIGKEGLDFLRHRWRANILFVDGHVENVPMTRSGMSPVGVSAGD